MKARWPRSPDTSGDRTSGAFWRWGHSCQMYPTVLIYMLSQPIFLQSHSPIVSDAFEISMQGRSHSYEYRYYFSHFTTFHDISRQGSKIRKFIHSKTSGHCYDFLRKSAGRLLFMNRNSVMRSGTCWMCRFYVELAKMKKRVAAKPRGADLELCVIF